jgi:hypothetical protein
MKKGFKGVHQFAKKQFRPFVYFLGWPIRVTTSIGYHSTSQKLSFYEAQNPAEDSSYLDVPDQKLTIMTCLE